eukprot:NODE_1614_length_1662_cov_37.966862_g1535_i0.p1 GENE.NODE_1614_length_1662_cov_37.966862_g1535_i0~~NODE_1614_length_1662_cov_37.966862_g1535_i0.p1  ORF type:complete len:437 (+),score=111.47 NODE_1614_length_1662_cov_37.966862_g1535_i0:75-1385(+)
MSQAQIQPINSLSPFIGRWWIKARVIDKSPKRTWSKPTSQGQLFSITLIDESNVAIRATIFQEGVDKYFDKIENEKVYIFTKGTVKNANKRFSNLPNDYELSFDQNSEITPAGDDNTIVRQKFSITPIGELAQKEKNSTVDLCCAIMEVGELASITTKAGESLKKRPIVVADQSGAQVELTLWQDTAENFDLPVGSIVGVKSARVGDFNGVTLSLTQGGSVTANPENLPQVQDVRAWSQGNAGGALTNLTTKFGGGGGGGGHDQRKTFSSIKEENLGLSEKPDFLTVRATLTYIKQENMWYPACKTCNKKVRPTGPNDSSFHCDKCIGETTASYRYIISCTANDHTGSTWLTAFQDVGAGLLGMEAEALHAAAEKDPGEVPRVCKAVCFKPYTIRLRAKEESFGDERKMKCVIQRIEKVNFRTESQLLLKEIARYL